MVEGKQVIILYYDPCSYKYVSRLFVVVQVTLISFSVFSGFLIVNFTIALYVSIEPLK